MPRGNPSELVPSKIGPEETIVPELPHDDNETQRTMPEESSVKGGKIPTQANTSHGDDSTGDTSETFLKGYEHESLLDGEFRSSGIYDEILDKEDHIRTRPWTSRPHHFFLWTHI